jgi:hypothetical protein
MSSTSVWLGGVLCSQRIASQSCPTRDNLPAQHKVIAICCCCVLGDTFRVNCPRRGTSGLSTLHLKTFASLDYTIPYFTLGFIPYLWLVLEEDSGRYYMGVISFGMANEKSNHRYVTEAIISSLHQLNQTL